LERFTGVLGILAVLLAAWLGSTNRRQIRWRTVAWGLGLQLVFAFLVLRFDYGQQAMAWAGGVVNAMLASTQAGTKILFGPLGVPTGSRAPSSPFKCCRPSSSSPRFSRCFTTSASCRL
jgi:CNT family concentrative nucleoside transporter